MKRAVVLVMFILGVNAAFGQLSFEDEQRIYRKAANKVETEARIRGYFVELPLLHTQSMTWITEESYSKQAWVVKEYKVSMNVVLMDRQGRLYRTDLNIKVGADEDGHLRAYNIRWGRFL